MSSPTVSDSPEASDNEELEPYEPYPLPHYPGLDTEYEQSEVLETHSPEALKAKEEHLRDALDKIEKLDEVLRVRDQQVKDLIAISTPPISRESERVDKAVKSPSEKQKNQSSVQATNAPAQESTTTATKDFLKRNVELGPEARYYSSLTEQEKGRVDMIVDEEESNILVPQGNSQDPGFSLEKDHYIRLKQIDETLRSMIPSQFWEAKSIIFTPDMNNQFDTMSQSTAPTSALWSRRDSKPVTMKDLHSVMNENPLKIMKSFELDRQKLTEMDQRIQELTSMELTTMITQSQIDALVFESIKEKADIEGVQLEII